MKKNTIILIAVITFLLFALLVIYGLKHSRGVPAKIEEPVKTVLEVPFINETIDLSNGLSEKLWDGLKGVEIKLFYQVMIMPWGKSNVSPINVKAFHNKEDIYFYITWRDMTENRKIERSVFSDAAAIMFPMDENIQPSTLMMGFMGHANIWQWKAVQDAEFWRVAVKEDKKTYSDFNYPFEEEETLTVSKPVYKSGANDLLAVSVGTISPKDTQNVNGRGVWDGEKWQVVFERALKHQDPEIDAIFNPGESKKCAFAVWQGANGDRGGRKSISDWVELDIE